MTQVLTTAQMRATEAAAMASGEVSGAELMERAGEGVVAAIFRRWPEYAASVGRAWHATVLCGPGNNGGDGFVVARLLAEKGWTVRVLFYGEADALPPDARLNHDRWLAMGKVERLSPKGEFFKTNLLVDALFGIGLTRPVDAFAGLLEDMREAGANMFSGPDSPYIGNIVAVDVPSGLCADSGRLLFDADGGMHPYPPFDLTVTFHALKPGHLLADGPVTCGEVVVAPLGLRSEDSKPRIETVGPGYLKKSGGHKFDHGHALVIAGGVGTGGAARLAARAALRVGAGLVTICPPTSALPEHAGPPDALMRRGVDDAGDLAVLLADERITAVCIGPGCGVERAAALLPTLLQTRRAALLDADALTALAKLGFAGLHDRCVLTPHPGEFARLFPDLAARLEEKPTSGPAFSKVDAAMAAAERCGAVVLLKGPDTVIADPAGQVRIHSAPDLPWLATAGSGDVLSGLIAGLLARRFTPRGMREHEHVRGALYAAATGAWLHAAAARRFGPGLIADDLPETLPAVLRDLGA